MSQIKSAVRDQNMYESEYWANQYHQSISPMSSVWITVVRQQMYINYSSKCTCISVFVLPPIFRDGAVNITRSGVNVSFIDSRRAAPRYYAAKRIDISKSRCVRSHTPVDPLEHFIATDLALHFLHHNSLTVSVATIVVLSNWYAEQLNDSVLQSMTDRRGKKHRKPASFQYAREFYASCGGPHSARDVFYELRMSTRRPVTATPVHRFACRKYIIVHMQADRTIQCYRRTGCMHGVGQFIITGTIFLKATAQCMARIRYSRASVHKTQHQGTVCTCSV